MCENLKNLEKKVDEITNNLKNLHCKKQNSNLDLKQQISETYIYLTKLENDLKRKEAQFNKDINSTHDTLKYKTNVLLIKNNVLKLKIEAGEYYKCKEKLTRVFMGNRFSTYFYNAKTEEAGFYPNKGCESDRSPSRSEADFRYRPGVTFDFYVAYLITESNDSQIEKLQKLYVMFDEFLNGAE